MMDQTFYAYDREVPVNLSAIEIHILAEEIGTSKRMPTDEVESTLKALQSESAVEYNTNCDQGIWRGYKLLC